MTSAAAVRGAHYASLVVCVVFVLLVARDQWFYLDEFVYLGYGRDAFGAFGAFLENYNQHWSTYPMLVYRGLRATVGLDPYWPYVLVGVAGHVTVVHLLWRLMLRVGVALLVATSLALVLLVSPAAAENVLWGVNIGFLGSLACGLGCLLLIPLEGAWTSRDRLAVLLATVSLPFSGMSVLMAGTVALALGLSRGWRIALRFVVVPVVVEGAWAVVYGGSGDLGGITRVPGFVGQGLVGAGAFLLGAEPLGLAFAVAYVALLGWLLRADVRSKSVPVALLVSAPVTLAVIAVGRADVNEPDAGRYAYHVLVLTMPAIGLWLTWLASTGLRVAGVAAVCVALALVGAVQLRDDAMNQAAAEQGVRAQVMGVASVVNDPNAQIVPDATVGAVLLTLTVDDVRRWLSDGYLPAAAAPESGVLRAASEIQVDVGKRPRAPVVAGPCRRLAAGERRELRPRAASSWPGSSASSANLRVGFVESGGVLHTRPVRVQGRFFVTDLHPGATFVVLHEGGAPIRLCAGGADV